MIMTQRIQYIGIRRPLMASFGDQEAFKFIHTIPQRLRRSAVVQVVRHEAVNTVAASILFTGPVWKEGVR